MRNNLAYCSVLVLLNRVRFRRKSKIPAILTGFSLDSSPQRGVFS